MTPEFAVKSGSFHADMFRVRRIGWRRFGNARFVSENETGYVSPEDSDVQFSFYSTDRIEKIGA